MLPEFLTGSYQRYKQDTAIYTTWVAKAAAACGYKPQATKRPHSDQPTPLKSPGLNEGSQVSATANAEPTQPSTGRLKGKERKAAKDATAKGKRPPVDTPKSCESSTVKYTVTTAELLRQAEAITQSRPKLQIKMPFSLQKVVERAIRARQRCSEWFQNSGVKNEYADKQHTHFIQILKQSLEILKPCVEAEEPTTSSQKTGAPLQERHNSIANRFAALKVEESPDIDPFEDFEVATNVTVTQKSKTPRDQATTAVYELEDEDEFDEELAFIVFCFFEDLHAIQEYIKELWRKYKARKCDLHTAAMTTNAAFELVRQSEEDLIAQAPKMFDRKRFWDTIAIIIFYANAFQQGICPEARLNTSESLRITPFDDFFYLSTARILMKYTILENLPKDIHLPYPILRDEVSRGHEDLLQTVNTIDKIMNLKEVNGAWDVGGSSERWHEKDKDVVMRIKFTSVYWILDTKMKGFPSLKEHMLTSNKEDHCESIDANTSQQHPHLGHQANTPAISRMENCPNPSKRPPKNPKFSNVSMDLLKLSGDVDIRSIQDNPDFQRAVRKKLVEAGRSPDEEAVIPIHEEDARKLGLKMIQPSKDLNFLFTSNPIHCGLISFSVLTDFEAAGISLCNWHKTIWPSAHLYNALQRESSITRTWPEMETLINLHMDALFAGYLPLSAYEYYVRFALALGLSTSNFARNPRNRTNNDRIRFRQGANGTKLKVTEMSSIFRQYFDKKTSLEESLVRLDHLIRDPGSKASTKERIASERPLTNLQFLVMLENNLPGIIQRLLFDYIILTKHCAKLLKSIREQFNLQFQIMYPRVPTEDSADQTLTWVVMQILEENNDLQSSQRGMHALVVGPQLRVAGEETQKFLGTYRPQDLISNFNALPRPVRTPSGIVPNHWNISIRHVSLSPPGDLVFLAQPDSDYVHTEGPIQIAEGQIPGHILNPKSLVTLQAIAKLIMKSFVEGTGAPSSIAASVPWSWATNDPNFCRRIMKVLTDMGVRHDLLTMTIAETEELTCCDKSWDRMNRELMGLVRHGR